MATSKSGVKNRGRQAAKRAKAHAREDRRRKVEARLLEGAKWHVMAEEMGVSIGTISRDVAAIRARWAKTVDDDARQSMMEKLGNIYTRAMERYNERKQVSFLTEARKALEALAKLQGFEAPKELLVKTQTVPAAEVLEKLGVHVLGLGAEADGEEE